MAIATEKLRRERWISEQSKKIKEITVKGLEPEIQRLIAKHKAEVQKIKVLHEVRLIHPYVAVYNIVGGVFNLVDGQMI